MTSLLQQKLRKKFGSIDQPVSESEIEDEAPSSAPKVSVSVVIPCFNDGMNIEDTVFSCLHQQGVFVEILIINDGSTDEQTLECLMTLADAYEYENVHVINHSSNRGIAETLNTGFAHASNEYICVLFPDNRIPSTFLFRAARALTQANKKDNSIVYVYGDCDTPNGFSVSPNISLQALCQPNYHFPQTFLIYQSAWTELVRHNVVGFDSETDGALKLFFLELFAVNLYGMRVPELIVKETRNPEPISKHAEKYIWNKIFTEYTLECPF